MNNIQYTKINDYKLFGIKIFETKEPLSQVEFDKILPIYQVTVKEDYYKAEFENL